MVAVEVDNWLDLRYILKVESIGLSGRTNREMREKEVSKVCLKNIKAYILFIGISQNTPCALSDLILTIIQQDQHYYPSYR